MTGKYFIVLVCLGLFLHLNPVVAAAGQPIIIDHQDVNAFSTLSDTDIARAAALKMLVRHASVGGNINSGLDQLYQQNHIYNPGKWDFQPRGNPGWEQKIDDFTTQTNLQSQENEVLAMKFCYIDQNADWQTYRNQMETLQAQYPANIFVWWTMPLMTTGNSAQTKRIQFNTQLRSYAQTHNIILFDIAAIESHDPSGNLYTNNNMEAMYPSYSSDGGHLSSLGSQRIAKAFWVMMATISPVSKPGDVNGDGVVNLFDYNLVVAGFGNPYTIFDYNTLVANYGT